MTPEDVARVEVEFGITLPKRYVDFLCNVTPDGAQWNFHLGIDILVEQNRDLRGTDYWEDHFFSIGHDGCGNEWCLNLKEQTDAVWIWEHDPLDGFSVIFDSMDELFKCYDA
ncbi:MAG: SMI1/KNR4 family protein [Planctomycetota bacterium]